MMKNILADGRWSGMHGIGRFSAEILSRLHHTDILTSGPNPLSIQNIFWQGQTLFRARKHYRVYFTPGFNPVLYSPIPFVVTLHDLIHLQAPGNGQLYKKLYYDFLIKPTVKRAFKILTISEYSKKSILEWVNIAPENIVNVSCGLSHHLTAIGPKYEPGYPYLLHVGNAEKIHKNVHRLLQAFSRAKTDPALRLMFTGKLSGELLRFVHDNHLENRIVMQPHLSEETLAACYRGADAIVFPSLYEGFGLPVLEGMASGVPVLTSNVTSIPEVAGDAALLIDPFSVEDIASGIEKILKDPPLRAALIQRGLERATRFDWDKTAQLVQNALDSV